jgi:molecular chaperone GrpE
MSGNGKQPEQDNVSVEIEAEAPPSRDPAAPQEPASDKNTSPTDAVASLNAEIEKLKTDKKEIYDRLLRTAADFENFKKRVKKEEAEAGDRGRKQLLGEILPAIDNLERAVEHAQAGDPVAEGVRLVLKQLYGALEKFNVKAFESVGKAFDPSVHEALQQQETDDHPAGSIVSEFQKGYMIGAKLLRPALVVVAKPKAAVQGEASPANTPPGGHSDGGI